MVKSLTQEASIGISQASVVDSDEKLQERVAFIHESIGTAAIVEQYIEGREIYVGILGNQTLQALPVWELFFTNMPEGARRIATDRVKWSVKYQKKYGIDSGPAADLTESQAERDSAPLQARVPRARAERLRAHRPPARRGGQRVGASKRTRTRRSPRVRTSPPPPRRRESATRACIQRIINLGLRWQPESFA